MSDLREKTQAAIEHFIRVSNTGGAFKSFFVQNVSKFYNISGTLSDDIFKSSSPFDGRFFDTVPIGRVLNRFSNDTGLIDVVRAFIVESR